MTSEGNFVQPAIPRFVGHYDHWSMLMENFLRSKEYWGLVETGYDEPASGSVLTDAQQKMTDELKLKDLKVKNYLFQAIDRTILDTILKKDTAKEIWDAMKKKFEGNARVKKSQLQALRREFETLEMKSGEEVIEYFSRVMIVANKMRVYGEDMQDVKIVEKILRTLTEKFNYIVCSIEESKDIDSLSVDELQSSLIVHEQKFRRTSSEEQVLKVAFEEGRGRGERGRGQGASRGRGRGRGRQTYNKANVECYNCHKLGHYQFECPSWDKEANCAELDEEEMLLMTYVEKNGARREDVWFFDSGCSNHMSGDKSLFCDFDESFKHTVKLGNNTRMEVTGRGNVRLKVKGTTHVVSEVYYVPELRNNLLSIGQLQERGLAIVIQHGKLKMYHPEKGLIVTTDMTTNRMFMMIASFLPQRAITQTSSCLYTRTQDMAHLWHCRYGHLSYKGLRTLQYKKMVEGIPHFDAPSRVCEGCLTGKQNRDTIPRKSNWRATEKLQLIHADLCGPIYPISNSKKRYLLCFIDDFSRKAWIYFLVEKSEALNLFKHFKNHVEKEVGGYIKCLRTDRGGEFTSFEFNEFCSQHGIKRQLTAAYTPQQNGVAERKNRTVMNMVRCMLYEKKLPKTFWPEAVNWAFYVLNRCPTLAVMNQTPEEAWSGRKPSVEHFRIFGCVAHVHVPEAKRKKLDARSITCVLLGVSEESKAYRLYDPVAKKIIISRDVVFEENKSWNWDKSYEEQMVVDLNCGNEEDNEITDAENKAVVSEEEEEVIEPGSSSQNGENERRNRRPPVWMKDYVIGKRRSEEKEDANVNLVLFTSADPMHFEEAVKHDKWRMAMDMEIKAIEKNNTWELTNLPTGAKKIGLKWVYKTKLKENGELDKFKARLVAKGYVQQQGIDYTEVFAPVARMDTVRMIVALAAQKGWNVYQLDVKSAFLHGELKEEVYVEQPKGYELEKYPQKVYKLKKALYGLKQAPRAWFNRIEAHFVSQGFEKCYSEQTLFIKTKEGGKILIVSLYVDDLIFTGNDEIMFAEFKSSMLKEFDMTDLGRMRYFLGIEVLQTSDGIYMYQRKYALEVLRKFKMENCNLVYNPIVPGCRLFKDENGVQVDETLYKQMVGCLMYLTATRPDLMYAVSLVSRYMSKPTELHILAVKRIMRYLKGTTELGVFYKKGGNEGLVGYTDSNYAGDLNDRKSTSGYVFMLGSGAVAWSSKKQPIVTLSTTEAEFVAGAACASQAIWMKRIFEKLSLEESKCTTIYCDNSSTIQLSKNPVLHGRSKHIDVRFHFLRDLTRDGVVELVYCGTKDQLADVMTKPLTVDVFQKFRSQLGVCQVPEIN
ncbi:hypothetical protein AB3S75_031241 [Citrus x aurantiifolia]